MIAVHTNSPGVAANTAVAPGCLFQALRAASAGSQMTPHSQARARRIYWVAKATPSFEFMRRAQRPTEIYAEIYIGA